MIENTKFYIYYKKSTRKQHEDVAIIKANSLEEAKNKFKEWYKDVSDETVKLIDTNENYETNSDYVANIMIVSDY